MVKNGCRGKYGLLSTWCVFGESLFEYLFELSEIATEDMLFLLDWGIGTPTYMGQWVEYYTQDL